MKLSEMKCMTKSSGAGMVMALAIIAGCGSSKNVLVVPPPDAPVGLPTPAAAGAVNTYSGAQSPGAWTLTLDNTKEAFSYQPVTYPAAATTGSVQPSGGFLSLGDAGLAYEIPGRVAVLQAGTAPSNRVFGVPQTDCYAIGGKMRFLYIGMFPGAQTVLAESSYDPLGYGSVVASTDSTGKTWSFENLQGGTGPLANSNLLPINTIVAGPTSFGGTCASANNQTGITLVGTSLLDRYWATTNPSGLNGPSVITQGPAATQSNIWIGPSGFFAADQSDPTQKPSAGASVAGVAEASAPLTAKAVAAGEYLGLVYEAPTTTATSFPAFPAATSPVGFGQVVAGAGSIITGGVFANGLTGTPNSDIQIDLGKEDGTLNGLFAAVSITVLDPAQNCANFYGAPTGFAIPHVVSGVNLQGYVTCTFPGVAVAGDPEGKFSIFISTYNWAANLGGVPMEFYLFQQ